MPRVGSDGASSASGPRHTWAPGPVAGHPPRASHPSSGNITSCRRPPRPLRQSPQERRSAWTPQAMAQELWPLQVRPRPRGACTRLEAGRTTFPRGASQASPGSRHIPAPVWEAVHSQSGDSKTFNHKREEGSPRQAHQRPPNIVAPRGSGEKPQPVLPQLVLLLRRPWPQEWGCTCGGQGWDRASEFRAQGETAVQDVDRKALLSAASLLLPRAHGSDPSNANTYCTNIAAV